MGKILGRTPQNVLKKDLSGEARGLQKAAKGIGSIPIQEKSYTPIWNILREKILTGGMWIPTGLPMIYFLTGVGNESLGSFTFNGRCS
jgi:hypothetical protein